MEADIPELWLAYSRMYLDKYGERPTIRIPDRDTLIIAILDLENDNANRRNPEFEESDGETAFD